MTSLAARLAGTIRAPRTTFARILTVTAPPCWDVLLLSTCALFLARALILGTDVGRLALVDQWEWTVTAFGGDVDDALYQQLREWSTHGIAISAGFALLLGPALTAVVSGVLALTVTRSATLRQTVSVVSHASVLLALRELLAAPVHYLNESLSSPTSLGVLMSDASDGNALARFLGAIDVFVVWWLVVVAIGVAKLIRRPIRLTLAVLAGAYVVIALAIALAMVATGGTA